MGNFFLGPASCRQRLRSAVEFAGLESQPGSILLYVVEGSTPFKSMFAEAIQGMDWLPAFMQGEDAQFSRLLLQLDGQINIELTISGTGPDQVSFASSSGSTIPAQRAAEILERLHKSFPIVPRTTLQNLLTPELAEFYQRREGTLQRLEEHSIRLFEEQAKFRQTVDGEAQARVDALRRELAEHRETLNEEHRKALAAVEGRAAELATREKELDNRSNTHARRAIRNDYKEELKRRANEFKLSTGTQDKRGPIAALCQLIMWGAAIGIVSSFIAPFVWSLDSHQWPLWSARASFALTFSATAVFYIRWQNLWFQQHANEEFRLKRLDLDIDRASWIIETALEWKTSAAGDMPPELMRDLSRNLFSDDAPVSAAKHPSESLTDAVLGAASTLSIKAGNAEIGLDRKSLKQIQKDT